MSVRLSDGEQISFGGKIHEHNLYYAVNRDYEEWDRPGNVSWEQMQNDPGLVVNISKEHTLPLDGKPKFKMELDVEEMQRHIGRP